MPKLTHSNLLEALNLIDGDSSPVITKKAKKQILKSKKVCENHDVIIGTSDSLQSPGFNTSQQMLLSYLRRAVSVGDWASCATYVTFLLSMSGRLLPVVWRTSLLVLLNHKDSKPEFLNEFLEQGCRLLSVDEKRHFLKEVMSLKEEEEDENTAMQAPAENHNISSDEEFEDEIQFLKSLQSVKK